MADVYGKWGMEDLERWLKEQGIDDPRDVTDIMLVSYWRQLNDKPIDLANQIAWHRGWWTRGGPLIVAENRELPTQFLDRKIKSKRSNSSFSLRNLPGRLKVVAFVDTEIEPSKQIIKYLSDLSEKYPNSQISVSVLVFDCDVTHMSRRNKTEAVGDGETYVKKILGDTQPNFRIADRHQVGMERSAMFCRKQLSPPSTNTSDVRRWLGADTVEWRQPPGG